MNKKIAAIVLLLLLAAGGLFLVLRRGHGGKPWNVLVITLDTTRADHIGAYGYRAALTPNLDRLAGEGILFRNCYAHVPLTLPSHSVLFTGRYPIANNVRNNGNYFLPASETTLAEYCAAGATTRGRSSPPSSCSPSSASTRGSRFTTTASTPMR